MSTQRTPPKSSERLVTVTSPVTPISSYGSDSQLNLETTLTELTTRRMKRKHSNVSSPENSSLLKQMRDMFTAFEEQQNLRFEKLLESVNTIKDQNMEFQKCIDFMSSKYDGIIDKIVDLEKQNKSHELKIIALESKIEQFERSSRAAAIEIRNVPIQPLENKSTLRSIVLKLGETVEQRMAASNIQDVYRLKTKSEDRSHIVVNFTSTEFKESFITQCRNYNKIRKENKLSTTSLLLPGPSKPIYIDECLTRLGRRLAYLARQLVKEQNFHSTWTSYGKVFIRKSPDSKAFRIDSEQDLQSLISN